MDLIKGMTYIIKEGRKFVKGTFQGYILNRSKNETSAEFYVNGRRTQIKNRKHILEDNAENRKKL